MRMPTRRPADDFAGTAMPRREVLTQLREGGGLYGRSHDGNRIPDMHIELDTADHEEPTWEVRTPESARKQRRFNRRTRMILALAAVAAVVVNAGAAWSYWQITDSQVAPASNGQAVEMVLRARSDLTDPLRRGASGDLTVTITNDNDFPIRINSVTGAGSVVADEEHVRAGCTASGVRLSRPPYRVRWEVERNTIGAFTVRGGLLMRADARKACDGATFTVPLRVSGVPLAGGR